MARIPGTPATRLLTERGVAWTGHVYDHDPRETHFGLEAATALGIDPARVFKTLVIAVEGVGLAVAIVPVSAMLDLRAFAQEVGGKHADLADRNAAERSSGYVQGGISPIGQRRLLPTVLDSSAVEWPTVLVSGGRRGFDIEIAPGDLLAVTQGVHASIVRNVA
jgi:Cys-tRNA(Pro)/Cys-tRNA(Cys) deacylase